MPVYPGAPTSRSAGLPRDGTQRLAVPAACRAPCRHPPILLGWQCRDRPSHVPRESRRPGSRRLHAGHRLANRRAPARLVLEQPHCPSFDAVSFRFDTSAAIRLRSPSWSLPDASTSAFPSSLTTNGVQPTQHEAVWSLPPAGRLRRATTFIFHAAPHPPRSPTDRPRFLRSWRTGARKLGFAP